MISSVPFIAVIIKLTLHLLNYYVVIVGVICHSKAKLMCKAALLSYLKCELCKMSPYVLIIKL